MTERTPDPTTVIIGRDLDVSVPIAAATDGIAVISGMADVLHEVVDYAKAGDYVIDWSSLKVGIEAAVFDDTDALLPPLRIRVRARGRKPDDGIAGALKAIALEAHEADKRDGRRPL